MPTLFDPPQAAKTNQPRDYLSFSSLSLYQSCPLRYFFKYVAGLPEKAVSASLIFGKPIHASIQLYFEQLLMGEPRRDLDVLLDAYQVAWKENEGQTILFGASETRDSLGQLADRLLWAFLESDLASPDGVIVGVEEELRGVIVPGCPDLLAYVDLIIETEDAVVVTDYKTSRSNWNDDKVEQAAPQLLLYGELVQTISPSKPVRLQFAVLPKIKSPTVTLHEVASDPAQVQRTKTVVQKVWHAIQGKHFYPSPSALNCPTCPFQAPCRAWRG